MRGHSESPGGSRGAFGGCGLRGSEDGWLSGGFDERRPDVEPLVWPVDATGLEAGEFSPSQSGVGGDGCEGSVPIGECRSELVDLGGIEEPHVGATSIGE